MEIASHLTGPTIGAQTRRILERHPQRVAFVDASGQHTYAEVLDLIGRYQAVLTQAGLRRGDGVAALGGNRFEVWALGIAVQSLGLYVTWLHPMGGAADQIFQIEDARVSALVVDETNHPERSRELTDFAAGAGLRTWTFSPAEFAEDLETAARDAGPQPFRDEGRHDDRAVLNYTGGTTGRPKGVTRRQFNVGPSGADILADFELPDTPRYLLIPPMSHVAGTNIGPTLSKGGTVHLMNGFDPAAVLATIERERISFTLFVPTMIYALLDHPTSSRGMCRASSTSSTGPRPCRNRACGSASSGSARCSRSCTGRRSAIRSRSCPARTTRTPGGCCPAASPSSP